MPAFSGSPEDSGMVAQNLSRENLCQNTYIPQKLSQFMEEDPQI